MYKIIGLFIALVPVAWCQTSCFDIQCPQVYQPVCGSNGRTYTSFCELYKDSCMDSTISFSYEGQCNACVNTVCNDLYDPVCGTDGQTYNNDCLLGVAACQNPSLTVDYRGSCMNAFSPEFAIMHDMVLN